VLLGEEGTSLLQGLCLRFAISIAHPKHTRVTLHPYTALKKIHFFSTMLNRALKRTKSHISLWENCTELDVSEAW